jgi:hypothetical protein
MGEKAPRQFALDFTRCTSYECGATLLTLLAYPEPAAGEEALARRHQSLCHLHLLDKSHTDETWSIAPQQIKPCYAFVDVVQIQKDLRQFDRRIRDRLQASKMANLFLCEAPQNTVPPLPGGIARLSLNEVSHVLADDVPGFVPSNVESRIWRPSLPVIHIAVALDLMLRRLDATDGNLLHPYRLIGRAEVVQDIVNDAQFIAELFYKSRSLKIAENTLIELHLVT